MPTIESPERKQSKKEALARFRARNRERLRLDQIEIRKSEKHQEWRRDYFSRPEVVAHLADYHQKPEVKEKQYKYQQTYKDGPKWRETYAMANRTWAYLLKKPRVGQKPEDCILG